MKRDMFIVAAIVVVGAGLRFPGLGSRSLCFDEAITASFLDMPASEVLVRSAEARAVHPPLSYLGLGAWAGLFGRSEASLRFPAAACGVLLVAGVYLLTKELARLGGDGRRDAAPALAAALVALSPLQVHLARQVRGYSLAAMLLAWAGWALIRALRAGRAAAPWWAPAALLALAACYTHHVATLSVAAQATFAAAYLLARRRDAGRSRGWGIAAAILVLGYVAPSVRVVVPQVRTVLGDYHDPITWEGALAEASLALGSTYQGASPKPGDPEAWAAALPALALGWLAVRGGWRGRYLALAGLLPPVVLAAFSLGSNRTLFVVKHLMFAQTAWLAGLAVFALGFRHPFGRRAAAAWLLLAASWCTLASWPVIGPEARPGMRGAIDHVSRLRRGGEPVASPSPFLIFGMAHHAEGRFAPKLVVAAHDRRRQRCSESLRDDQLVTAGALDATGSAGLWLVTCESSYPPQFITDYTPSRRWEADGIWHFEQDYYFDRPIRVMHYRSRTVATPGHVAVPASGATSLR